MNQPGGQHEKSANEPIELKPSVPLAKGATPVPYRPVHLCPQCDYNLGGLTSRRCPECGSFFTLIAARRHAFEKSQAGRRRRREERRQKRKSSIWLFLPEDVSAALFVLGIVLVVLGFVSPAIVDVVSPRGAGWLAQYAPFVRTLFRIMIVCTITVPVDAVIAVVAARRGWSWGPTMLIIGVLTCVAGALIAIT
jgi:hypothetical protein